MNNSQSKKRRSRYKRDPENKKNGRFQIAGDGQILLLIHEFRYLTRPLLELLTGRKGTPIKNRLQFLWHEHYIDKIQFPKNYFVKGSTPDIYILGKEGEKFYQQTQGQKPDPSPKRNRNKDQQLEHTLLINTVRAMITRACNNNPDLELVKWIRTGKDCQDKVVINGKSKTISPDGFFVIKKSNGRYGYYFLEVDRSTEHTPRFTEKLSNYLAYYKNIKYESDKLEKKDKTKLTNRFKIPGFMVLTVIENDIEWQKVRYSDRLKDFIDSGYKASENKGFRGFWFTTKSRLDMKEPESILSYIWEISHPQELDKFHSILE